jgi:hypothetical protein
MSDAYSMAIYFSTIWKSTTRERESSYLCTFASPFPVLNVILLQKANKYYSCETDSQKRTVKSTKPVCVVVSTLTEIYLTLHMTCPLDRRCIIYFLTAVWIGVCWPIIDRTELCVLCCGDFAKH